MENSGAGPAGPQPGVRPHRQAARWGWGVLHPRRAEPRVGSMTQGQRDTNRKGSWTARVASDTPPSASIWGASLTASSRETPSFCPHQLRNFGVSLSAAKGCFFTRSQSSQNSWRSKGVQGRRGGTTSGCRGAGSAVSRAERLPHGGDRPPGSGSVTAATAPARPWAACEGRVRKEGSSLCPLESRHYLRFWGLLPVCSVSPGTFRTCSRALHGDTRWSSSGRSHVRNLPEFGVTSSSEPLPEARSELDHELCYIRRPLGTKRAPRPRGQRRLNSTSSSSQLAGSSE